MMILNVDKPCVWFTPIGECMSGAIIKMYSEHGACIGSGSFPMSFKNNRINIL